MLIINKNISDLWKSGKIICVTTNGFIKKSGESVMGAGTAGEMVKVIPDLPKYLAKFIGLYGHVVGFIYNNIISFPTKPVTGQIGDALPSFIQKMGGIEKIKGPVPGCWCKSDINIIERSLDQLINLIDLYNLQEVFLPVPGTGYGQLDFKKVENALLKIKNIKQIKLISNEFGKKE